MRGLRITRLVSTAAQITWSKLSCREHNGVAVGYMYELTRHLRHSRQPLNVMFGIINNTVLDLNSLIPFTNYTVRVRFANHLYQGPRTALDFVTFEDCKYKISIAAFFVVSNCVDKFTLFTSFPFVMRFVIIYRCRHLL